MFILILDLQRMLELFIRWHDSPRIVNSAPEFDVEWVILFEEH